MMKLREFLEHLENIEEECNTTHGEPDIRFHLHTKDDVDTLYFFEDDVFLKIEASIRMGCGCWDGASINLTLDNENEHIKEKGE